MVYTSMRHKHTQKLSQPQQVQQIRMESALKVRSYEFQKVTFVIYLKV